MTEYREAYCEMKIKEKGLTGKSAVLRKETMAQGKKGFNAFREMAAANGKGKDKGKEKAKPEVWLDFLGNRIRVYDEDGGKIKEEDVPYVKGASLKFEGVEGDVSFDEIKVCSVGFVVSDVVLLLFCRSIYRALSKSASLARLSCNTRKAIPGAW